MTTTSYISLFLLFYLCLLFPKTPDLQFEHYTVENGLSNNYIVSILQDSSDFMWFGTNDGLNRWDGHSFKVFRWDPTDSSSITLGAVNTLLQASSGTMWVGTNGGLNRYNQETESFTRYGMRENDLNSLSDPTIFDLYEDKVGNLWIGSHSGLNLYNPDLDNFTRFMPQSGDTELNRSYNNIQSICPYHDGRILLGTTAGLIIFDPKTIQFERVPCPYEIPRTPVVNWWWPIRKIIMDRQGMFWFGMNSGGLVKFDFESGRVRLFSRAPYDSSHFSAYNVTAMCETREGILWVGTSVDGLNKFNPGSEQFTVYKHNSDDEKSISSSQISALYEDQQGNLWIGTRDKGINLLAKWRKPFHRYSQEPINQQSIGDCEITDICEDHRGNLWITTNGSDLAVLDLKTGSTKKYKRDFNDPRSISQPFLQAVYCDRSGTIWIGAMSLNRYDPITNSFIKYHNDYNNPQSHVYAAIKTIYEDQHGILWFGTNGEGLERLDRTAEIFHRYQHNPQDPNSLGNNFIQSINQDHKERLWVGTGIGLCRLIKDKNGKEQFIIYRHKVSDPFRTLRDVIYDIYEDTNERLWLATCAGLSLYDWRTDSIREYNDKNDFLVNCWIYRIKEDSQKNLWLRTNRGLIKFNPDKRSYRIYDERDGLKNCKSVYMGYKAFLQSESGIMYYGCANDIVFFHPDSIKDNPHLPKVKLTNFLLFNSPASIGLQEVLKKSVSLTKEINLSYNQNNISFEFAALDFTAPEKNQYAYRMDGIESEWVYCGNRHYANYTSLDPGEYIFRIKASNNDGIWNENGAMVRIIITPPWWKTNWAYSIYILMMISIIAGIWRFQTNRIRMRHQLEMEHLHAEKLEEVDRMKSHFFANISHEFRTPLTLILGPLERLLTRYVDEDSHQDLKIMQRSAGRLQRLINQLLDLSKLEAGRMKLLVQKENIVVLIRNFVQAFESLAKLKNIQLKFRSKHKNILGYVDREKLETMINNLLSNAFKFTPEGGRVTVQISPTPLSIPPLNKEGKPLGVEITVSDTGSGIPPDRLPHIFDRFYQADDSYIHNQEGTGIGLALTRELVEFHKGDISVSSKVGKGTTFVIRLPIGKSIYAKEEIVTTTTPLFPPLPRGEDKGGCDAGDIKIQKTTVSKKNLRKSIPVLLIVEDNPDMLTYIRKTLENEYRILEATDGEKGFTKCAGVIPDLVISDVMMPRMDGIQLCTKLKQDERTSHIPVILLTARAAAEDRIGGLETGADDYIIKPFHARELQVRVQNLIQQRRLLQERFRKEGILQPEEMEITTTDQKFLQNALDIVKSHLSDENFTVINFSEEIGMSRALLHRKLRALINLSPSEFIRNFRLNQAAQLLAKHSGNVTEIAYRVGFNNLSYFARCFHQQFGVSPSFYASKHPHS